MITYNNTTAMIGAKAVVTTLTELGVDTVFGYPGGVVLDLYDELYKQNKIKHILVRHEQAAVHAAEGYARVSGKCGVVLVTSGPGATNTVTGIANAFLDGYPLVILTGQVATNLIGKNSFQEVNICDMVKSCTKAVFQVTQADKLKETLYQAFSIANSNKKGPVLVDIAKNVLSEKVEYNLEKNFQYLNSTSFPQLNQDINIIYNKIASSKAPVIVSGGGVKHANACEELLKFAKNLNIPVVSTMMGMGTFPQKDLNFFGMLGIFGNFSANEIIKHSDLVISLGARFNDRITCKFQKQDLDNKIIQIDINEKEFGKNYSPILTLNMDIKDFLAKINQKFSTKSVSFDLQLNKIQYLKNNNITPKKATNLMHSFEVIKKIDQIAPNKNVIFTSEVGQHQLWAIKNLTLTPQREILVSGGLGTMGFGFPAAIGAAIAHPDKTIVCITGDGSFQMTLEELAVCKEYKLNIKIIILNNGYLGMVRQLQEKNCDNRYSQTKIANPNFTALADSYGISGIKVYTLNELEKALKQVFISNQTSVIDCEIEPMEVL